MARETVQVSRERVGMSRKGSLSDMVMEFFEEMEGERLGKKEGAESDYEENEGSIANLDEDELFWTSQYNDLQEALARNSSTEKKIRLDTEEAIQKMRAEGSICSCSGRDVEYCRKCLLGYVADQLKKRGYNSALCKSKWNRSLDIPSGEHSYVDVVIDSKSGKRSPIRVVIELNFRGEFEMARSSQKYKTLVNSLPELFVGKSEKLRSVVRIMCASAKKCMRDNNMHMGPWRKQKYMQSKWLSTPERITSGPFVQAAPVVTVPERQHRKQTASMLTFDLHLTAVKVV
ncbi:hypothetical protein LUZ63_013675 [Rhynchospora breviuscula]|uniref:Uncharacterized protein n=1 Tax=Rhynchospora breviuscula TaxID=2022672 RepID=A0A9Q0HL60_9POAL|nr:hypothetical protein LUZ63_013675 [Rhynchospora breviuscula]